MLTKPIVELTIDDVRALIGVAESRYLDFKSAPVGAADRDKREFLADISAFANASGGDVLFGVDEQEGVASAVNGIPLSDADKEILRLGDLIRSGLEPRLTHFDIKWLSLGEGKGVLLVRVPRSWNAPHRVTLQGHDKFYIRNSAGKHPMNVDELRAAFNLSEAVAQRIRQFHAERVRLAHHDGAALALNDGPKLVLHVIPLSAFTDPVEVRPTQQDVPLLSPFGASGWSYVHTLDGFATHTTQQVTNGPVRAYTLAFRNGILEAVGVLPTAEKDASIISLATIERYVLSSWRPFLQFLERYEVQPPYYVFVSLLRVKGMSPHTDEWNSVYPMKFRGDTLSLPEFAVSADAVGKTAPELFHAAFDVLANAFGLEKSLQYNKPDGSYGYRY